MFIWLIKFCTKLQQQQPFNGLFSRTTWGSRYQKGKTNLDFTGARDSEWQWHQLGHMQVCTLLQTDSGVLLKMEVGIRKGAWQRAWRYPAYLWSLRWIYAVKKTPEVGIRHIPAYTPQYTTADRQPRQYPTTLFFTVRMPFLPPNQQRQSTEGTHQITNMGQYSVSIEWMEPIFN